MEYIRDYVEGMLFSGEIIVLLMHISKVTKIVWHGDAPFGS